MDVALEMTNKVFKSYVRNVATPESTIAYILFNGGANMTGDLASTCQSLSTQIHLYGIMKKSIVRR